MVGEHSVAVKRYRKEAVGAGKLDRRKDSVGISSDNAGENPARRKPKVS